MALPKLTSEVLLQAIRQLQSFASRVDLIYESFQAADNLAIFSGLREPSGDFQGLATLRARAFVLHYAARQLVETRRKIEAVDYTEEIDYAEAIRVMEAQTCADPVSCTAADAESPDLHPPGTFYFFSKMPLELQSMIWEAASQPPICKLYFQQFDCDRGRIAHLPASNAMKDKAIWQVCKESRKRITRVYQKAQASMADATDASCVDSQDGNHRGKHRTVSWECTT